ncbi:MAG: glycosyltransferase family 2 protein [Bryobacteraceae bacterium]
MLTLAGLPVSLWIAGALAFFYAAIIVKSRINYLSLPEIEIQPRPQQSPDCMVIIPARNEEENIVRAVKSLPHDTVIVVDDASTDRTAELAREAGAGVLPAPKLGKGQIGKSNACAEGARVLTSKWILFADADTWYEQGFLDAAVAHADANKLDFLSIYLRPVHETLGERVLSPFAEALYFFAMNPSRSDLAGFNGQCILVRREPYEFVGGHGTVIRDLFEGMKLAGLAQRHRMKFSIARAHYLGRVRISPSMIKRNAYRFTTARQAMGALLLFAALLFALWLPALVWLLLDQLVVASAVFTLWPMFLLGGWYQGYARAVFAPLGIYGTLPSLFNAFLCALTGRPLEWKGRTI